MRIATFNLENLDEPSRASHPTEIQRAAVLLPQLLRLNADILCFQEVHGQERVDQPRRLLTLQALIKDTQYELYHQACTVTSQGQVYDKRNLVILSRYPIVESQQIRNDIVGELSYRRVTASPREPDAKPVGWERPILYCVLDTPLGRVHLINLHLKSRIPSAIPGQKSSRGYTSASGWAEGFFISSMKRVGQALEVRMLVDTIFDQEPAAQIIVCGDFNAEPGQVPVEAIIGTVENTGNADLSMRQLIPASTSMAKDMRFTHIHEGRANLLDHMLFSRELLAQYDHAEIHNEILHDETVAFAMDKKFPESDHAPFLAIFRDQMPINPNGPRPH